jgi:hypothetical protein
MNLPQTITLLVDPLEQSKRGLFCLADFIEAGDESLLLFSVFLTLNYTGFAQALDKVVRFRIIKLGS